MAKQCPEEFNPWPPFVDIFASVILVMMLFLLITIVNIGYYAQFKYKVSYSASTVTKAPIQPDDQTKVEEKKEECIVQKTPQKKELTKEDLFSFHKVAPLVDANASNILFSGGKSEGNAVRYAAEEKNVETTKQRLEKKELQLAIIFHDKEVFINSKTKRKLKMFINDIKRRSKNAQFTIYAADPRNVISSTIAKQISLGRVLNIQSILKQSRIPKKNIHFNLRNQIPSSSDYGEVLIKVRIP